MKHFILSLLLAVLIISCKPGNEKVVDTTFADNLITHYTISPAAKANEQDIVFWKERIDPKAPGIVNESKYAAALNARFHFFGDIADLQMADSVLHKIDTDYNHKEASPLLALNAHAISQHRFREADSFLLKAKQVGLKKYEEFAASFDVDFELGRYSNAALELRLIKSSGDYGYYFRHSKLNHLNGEIDSAIADMLTAASLSENVEVLKRAALSNAADLCIHAGKLQQANDLYVQCIHINNDDYHSITGLGWIALVHDKNDSLAYRLFQFVRTKTQLPDPLFKLYQWADANGDSGKQKEYARAFESIVTQPAYGSMYNKYLIELYTGILHQPLKAVALAKKELENRATPQTYAWYAWSLVAANDKTTAWKIYEQFVSGKALEGTELYWMGKLMESLQKGYNQREFLKAAYNNKYDLSPHMVRDIEKTLEE